MFCVRLEVNRLCPRADSTPKSALKDMRRAADRKECLERISTEGFSRIMHLEKGKNN